MSEMRNDGRPAMDQRVDDTSDLLADMNKRSLNFVLNVQKATLEVLLDACNLAFERMNTELSIANEFASKIAEAHSASGLRQVYEECGNHQLDFICRDSERFFRCWQRLSDRTSRLLLGPMPEGYSSEC